MLFILFLACIETKEVPLEPKVEHCISTTQSNLPGIRLHFSDAPCSFSQKEIKNGKGIVIPYTLTVEKEWEALYSHPQDDGGCGSPNESGLLLFEKISGLDQLYCICDEGECGGEILPTRSRKGVYPQGFIWDGRNWMGPSCHDAPKGDFFPVGVYTLQVRATGERALEEQRIPFSVEATLKVHIKP